MVKEWTSLRVRTSTRLRLLEFTGGSATLSESGEVIYLHLPAGGPSADDVLNGLLDRAEREKARQASYRERYRNKTHNPA